MVTDTHKRLFGFYAKIDRAKEHLDRLKASFDSFATSGDSYAVLKEFDSKTGEYLFRIRIKQPPPLVEWSLLIGDTFHNTRTALDHLFFALVLKNNSGGIKENTSSISFPILREASTFNGRRVNLERWVGKKALAMLEAIQPYKTPGGCSSSPLLFLHDRDIFDKHKLLLPTIQVFKETTINVTPREGCKPFYDAFINLVDLEDNAIIGRVRVHVPQDVVDVDYHPSFDVIFKGQISRLRVVPTLKDMIEMVEGIGKDFLPLL